MGFNWSQIDEIKKVFPRTINNKLDKNIFYLRCLDSDWQQKYLLFFLSSMLPVGRSEIDLLELKYDCGDLITIFFAISNKENSFKKPALVLNCTNEQKLKLFSRFNPSLVSLVEDKNSLIIFKKNLTELLMIVTIILIPGTLLFFDFSPAKLLIILVILLIIEDTVIRWFIAYRQQQQFKDKNSSLLEEQKKLEQIRRSALASYM